MMNKRNDEGFALAYVVVVIVILCTLALALMSSTLSTLQAQEKMVQRMQDKYEAQGEIEKLVAELEAELAENAYSFSGSGYSNKANALDAAKNDISSIINSSDFTLTFLTNDFTSLNHSDEGSHDYDGVYTYEVTSDPKTVSVHATISISFDIGLDDQTPPPIENEDGTITDPAPNFTYSVLTSSPNFTLYEIASVDPPLEGGESDA